MTYSERMELYTKIEEKRGCPLIVYATSSRQGAPGNMASDVIPEFTKQLLTIPKEETNIDILIVSNGGDPTVSWRIISLLRERFSRIGVLLPFTAYSAATLLALGANEIIMHPFSNLGPVDPQLTYKRKNNIGKDAKEETIQFGSEDLRHFIDFVRNDVGITDQEQMEKTFELVCQDIGALPIGIAKRSTHLALSMGEKLLSLHMEDKSKATAISEALNKSFYHHGYPLGRSEAKSIGLNIIEPDDELEGLIWSVWEDMEIEMECNKPFNPLELVLNDPETCNLLTPVRQVQMPANLPPKLMQQAFNQILQQINVVSIEPIDYLLFSATLESTRAASRFVTNGKINAIRLPDMNISVNNIKTSYGWVPFTQEHGE
ncbi:hypothetical protein RE474_04380 [Methanolobus sediminis]|uniref:Serine dehydrogenase proteinase n=1 Tax=Methanolobus sediminis TaxID=3072978 RepID=A0AA51YMU9_9EURY|nr:hypothetical protein [Methanolobus sediminis]WMW25963.1 hypothetical protein RE474_04380 [Methanolobus sediminis]